MSDQSTNKPQILVVDDSKVIRLAARKMLGTDYEIHLAEDGLMGWEMLQQNNNISVVFTDLVMPNFDGMKLLENIRGSSDEHIANMPVIIMTGLDDSENGKQTVFDAGATDFISKPFESIDLISRARSYAGLSRKVVELEKKTGHDKLTGLYNANSLQEQGSKAFSFADRHKLSISAAYFEVRDFEDLFLAYGKNVAQHVIVAVGKRLQDVMREEDIAARVAVAKYALVLPMTNRQKTEIVIDRVRESISKLVFDTGKEKIRVNFVVGYSSPDISAGIEFNEMLEQADAALQIANDSATDKVVCYGDDITSEEPELEVFDEDIEEAFFHILEGNFYKIPEEYLSAVLERITPFLQYVENQTAEQSPDDHNEKNVAI